MKKIIQQLFIICCCIMLCGVTGNATTVDNSNETDSQTVIRVPFAEISDIYFNKRTVTKNEKLKYRFKLTFLDTFEQDGRKPFYFNKYEIEVCWRSSKKQYLTKKYLCERQENFVILEDTIPIKNGMQSGEWQLESLFIFGLGKSECDRGIAVIQQKNEQYKPDEGDADLSPISFTVTGVKKKADEKAPTFVEKSLKVSKNKLRPNKKATFSVKIKDASKITEVACVWYESAEEGIYSNYKKLKYNSKTKMYECKYKIRSHVQKAQLNSIITKDVYGNYEEYTLDKKKYKKKYGKAFSKMTIYLKE